MILRRALLILALVIPPTLGLTAATAMRWLRYERSLRGALIFLGAYAAWGALVRLGVVAGRVRKRRRRKTAAADRGISTPDWFAPPFRVEVISGGIETNNSMTS